MGFEIEAGWSFRPRARQAKRQAHQRTERRFDRAHIERNRRSPQNGRRGGIARAFDNPAKATPVIAAVFQAGHAPVVVTAGDRSRRCERAVKREDLGSVERVAGGGPGGGDAGRDDRSPGRSDPLRARPLPRRKRQDVSLSFSGRAVERADLRRWRGDPCRRARAGPRTRPGVAPARMRTTSAVRHRDEQAATVGSFALHAFRSAARVDGAQRPSQKCTKAIPRSCTTIHCLGEARRASDRQIDLRRPREPPWTEPSVRTSSSVRRRVLSLIEIKAYSACPRMKRSAPPRSCRAEQPFGTLDVEHVIERVALRPQRDSLSPGDRRAEAELSPASPQGARG